MPRAAQYRVVRKIADGGMAEIFLAHQLGAEGFTKPVVLKRILPALAADPAFVRMLVDEAHIASTLNHSNLVQVLDLRRSQDEQYFLVLEFVDGWSLEQLRRRALAAKLKLPLPIALSIVGALCRGLAYVHTRRRNGKALGIVHRDVTPQNVLVSREGEVKLADFGIAMAVDRREKSGTGVIKGKCAYMSPEQTMGSKLDGRSDLFAVGTLLYLLTTGRKPFAGPTDFDVLMQVRKARYDKPSTFVRVFNEDVERFIVRALRADRSKRWQSADQMANRIEAILGKLGQPSGPAALKRWLESLSSRDGIALTPHSPDASSSPDTSSSLDDSSSTIEIDTRDLELQDVRSPAAMAQRQTETNTVQETDGSGEEPDEESDHATEVKSEPKVEERTKEHATRMRLQRRSPNAAEIPAAAAAGSVVADEPVRRGPTLGSPTRVRRPRRWLRATACMLALVVLLGATAYLARPYLPAWLADAIDDLIGNLPLGTTDPKPPAHDSSTSVRGPPRGSTWQYRPALTSSRR